jgi:hypothetical protein
MSDSYDSAVAQVPARATVTAWDGDSARPIPGPTASLTIELDAETVWVEYTTDGGSVAVLQFASKIEGGAGAPVPFIPSWA